MQPLIGSPGAIGGYSSAALPEPGTDVNFPSAGWYPTIKRLFDWGVALVLFVLSGPLVVASMLLVRLTSPGPAIYRQTRLGRGRRPFTIYKIRTMSHNCEALTGARWSMPNDARVTAVGRFLRRSHLDELPQLWNILRGDMSLVGPRPERPEFVSELVRVVARYGDRMHVRPGVTGLAQVQLPPDTDLESVRRKLRYDLYYVAHGSLWLDLRLALCTGLSLLGIPFRLSVDFLLVPGAREVELGHSAVAIPRTVDGLGATPRLDPQTTTTF